MKAAAVAAALCMAAAAPHTYAALTETITIEKIGQPADYLPATGKCGENLTWKMDSATGTLTISGTGRMYDYLNTDKNPFFGQTSIKKIVVNDGATYIGNYAFYQCIGVTSITLPSTVTGIGERSFGVCKKITGLTIPERVTEIGSNAFYNCAALESVNIPVSVNKLGENVFSKTSALSDIYYGGSETEWNAIDYNNLAGVKKTYNDIRSYLALSTGTTVHFASGGTDTGSNTGTSDGTTDSGVIESGTCGENLTWTLGSSGTLTISGTGDMYDNPATRWKTLRNRISSIVIESGATSVGAYAFEGLLNVSSVSLPDTLRSIGTNAFDNTGASAGIDYIEIPDGVLLSAGAFRFSGIVRVKLPSDLVEIPAETFSNSGLISADIPDTVESIGEDAFGYCSDLMRVTLPEGLRTLGNKVFEYSTSLEYINFPDSLTSVGDDTFAGCVSLTNITLPGSVKTVGARAFSGCTDLETADIPTSVTSLGYRAFQNDTALDTIYYRGTEGEWYSVFEPLDINTESEVRSYIGISDDVKLIFRASPVLPVYDNGLSANTNSAIPGQEFDLFIYIPSSSRNADTVSARVDFDSDVFEVVNWYSNDISSPYYIRNLIPGSVAYQGDDYISVSSSNTLPAVNMSRGILMKARMKVKDTARAGDYSLRLTKSDVVIYDENRYASDKLWTPEVESLTISVSTNPVMGRITGFGDNEGYITVTLLDQNGDVLGKMTTSDGSFIFSGLTSGTTYNISASMPRCVTRTISFKAGSSVVNADIILRKYGDVNGDSTVDAKDATQILRFDAGMTSAITSADEADREYLKTVANITGSGTPWAGDATQVLRYDAGLSSLFDRLT